jgi:predicted nucleotidyltransferase
VIEFRDATDDDGVNNVPAAVLLRVVVGSRAYGLDTDESDTDVRGVYAPRASLHWSLDGVPEQLESDKEQTILWEVGKFVRLALKGNPAILEALHSPLVLAASPLGRELREMRAGFLSRRVVRTFSGYAEDQFRGLQRAFDRDARVKWGHAMHLCRLLIVGERLVRTGELVLDATPDRERLLAIKRGEVAWADVSAWRVELAARFERAAASTPLPEEPDHAGADAYLLRIRREMARRDSRPVRVLSAPPTTSATGQGLKLDLCERIAARQPYPLLFVTVSGAHLYGFPSPDSDYDLRGVHVLPARDMLGLGEPRETVETADVEDGVEIDLVTHDAAKFCRMLLKRNGYVLEQLTSPLVVRTGAAHAELVSLVPSLLTKHHVHHYLGFAATQWGLFLKDTRVKPLLYTYRVLLTGIHLMRTGEVEANLPRLCARWARELGVAYVPELIAIKTAGLEKGVLSGADVEFYARECGRLTAELERAGAETSLPEAPRGRGALSDLVIRLRGIE